jgi:hypothetical protein
MNKKYFLIIFILVVLLFSSCFGQRNRRTAIIPTPDTEFFDFTLPIKMEDIMETKGGAGAGIMPAWLRSYINGGIKEVEKMEEYISKYVFIGRSEGLNFNAMVKWAENFSSSRDAVMLVARRIENKLVSSASLYPDDEYGIFYERIIGNTYSSVYPGAVKEDTYWIRLRVDNEDGSTELYVFFVLISIDKTVLQEGVQNIISKSIPPGNMPSGSVSAYQRNAIERLQRNFFEGF